MIERKVEDQEIEAPGATPQRPVVDIFRVKKSLETAAQQRRRKKFESCARYDLPRGLVR